jgi:hypothetical protein
MSLPEQVAVIGTTVGLLVHNDGTTTMARTCSPEGVWGRARAADLLYRQ